MARSLTDLGVVACDQQDYLAAHAVYREGLEVFAGLAHKRGIARALEGFACSACAQGNPVRALAIAASAAHLRQQIGAPMPLRDAAKLDQHLQPAWRSLQDHEGRAAWEQGWARSLEDAINYALEKGDAAIRG
jgi:hypothetical protein